MKLVKKSPPSSEERKHITKKCPECFQHVPLDEEACPSCKAPLGKVQVHGLADRPINWKAYTICILAWLVLIVYLKWAFF